MSEGGRPADPRADARSNVFLSAILATEARTVPVRVRNISARGALLDGADLPAAGSAIRIVRGGLTATGEIAWVAETQCGVRFDAPVTVRDWVKKVEHAGQQRVDKAIALIRSQTHDRKLNAISADSRDSLQAICAELKALSERLANDPAVVTMLADDLLALDAISQRLDQAVTKA